MIVWLTAHHQQQTSKCIHDHNNYASHPSLKHVAVHVLLPRTGRTESGFMTMYSLPVGWFKRWNAKHSYHSTKTHTSKTIMCTSNCTAGTIISIIVVRKRIFHHFEVWCQGIPSTVHSDSQMCVSHKKGSRIVLRQQTITRIPVFTELNPFAGGAQLWRHTQWAGLLRVC